MKKLGMVLSGGGVRGIAHIGVLKFFEEKNIEIHSFSGASAGSIVSVLAASGYSADEILGIAKKHKIFSLIKPQWPSLGLTALDKLPTLLKKYCKVDRLEKLDQPVAISISSLTTGKSVIAKEGEIYPIVQASCSIPVLFQPVEIDGELYVDGGLLNNIPSQAFRDETDVQIGVDLVPGIPVKKEEISSIFQLSIRTFELAISSSAKSGRDICDLVLVPPLRDNQAVFFAKNMEGLFEKGYQEAKNNWEEIDRVLNS